MSACHFTAVSLAISTSSESQRDDNAGSMLVLSTQCRVHHLRAHELLLEHAAQLDFIIVHSWEIFSSVVIGVVLSHLPQVLVEISTLTWLGVFVTLVALGAALIEL